MKRIIKKNYKIVAGIIIGGIISGVGVYAATTISSSNISYDNKASGLTSTNLKGAIDELNAKAKELKEGKFVAAYTYNENSSSSTYCVTGEEPTCRKNECYKINLSLGSVTCKPGDIILYRVNASSIVKFHFIKWKSGADSIEMQSHNNIIESVKWGTISSAGSSEGALIAREALRLKTQNWTNVLTSGYYNSCSTNATIGDASLKDCLGYVSDYSIRAHIIDVDTLLGLGCRVSESNSCPKWVNHDSYWTNDWYGYAPYLPWSINGGLSYTSRENLGVKAVVDVDPALPGS